MNNFCTSATMYELCDFANRYIMKKGLVPRTAEIDYSHGDDWFKLTVRYQYGTKRVYTFRFRPSKIPAKAQIINWINIKFK